MEYKESSELKEFNRLFRECDEIYHKIAVKSGISDSAFMILYSIVEFGDNCRQKDIANYFCLSKQTINSSIQKLEKAGIIELKPLKGRDMQIVLTETGQKLADGKIIPVIEIEKSTLACMGRQDARKFICLTQKYVDIFKEKANEIL